MAKIFFTRDSLSALISEIKEYVASAISGKSDTDHGHAISDITDLQKALDDTEVAIEEANIKAATRDAAVLAEAQAYADNLDLIDVSDIDNICGAVIHVASEEGVVF